MPLTTYNTKQLGNFYPNVMEKYSKQRSVVIIFRKKNFLTDLQGIDLSQCVSILLVAQKAAKKLSEIAIAKFDFIVFFDMLESETKPVWRDLSQSFYVEPAEFLRNLIQNTTIQGNAIHLVANEEPTLYFVAKMRSELSLSGYGFDDMVRFLDKTAVKEWAKAHGIRVAKTFNLEANMRSDDQIINKITEALKFPIFIKPRFGCALVGCRRVENHEQLANWSIETADQPFTYLLEECFQGKEVAAYALVQNGAIVTIRLFQNIYPISDFVLSQKPLAKIQIGKGEALFVQLLRFCEKVAKEFRPQDGLFSIQAFHFGEEDFALVEVSSRMPGGLFTSLVLANTGISIESLHIALSCKLPVDQSLINTVNKGPFVAYIRYPRKAGIVKFISKLPELCSVRKSKWRINVGDTIENPRALAHRHEALSLELSSESFDQLKSDFSVLVEQFLPFTLDSA